MPASLAYKRARPTCRNGLIRGWKNFILPGELRGLLERGGNGAVFFFAELNGLFDGGFFEMAAKAVENVEFAPDLGRVWSAFAGADDVERLKLLALLLEDDDDVG